MSVVWSSHLIPAYGLVLDHLAHERLAEAAAAVVGEHVDVREVRDREAVGDGAAEADLALAVVEADDACCLVDQPILRLPGAPGRPVALLAEEAVHLGAVDPRCVVVELEPVAELAPHALSLSRTITTSVTRRASSAGSRRAPRTTT